MVRKSSSRGKKGKMDDDVEMVDAPAHSTGACHLPEAGRAGLRPPPGFEHLASGPLTGEQVPGSTAESSVNSGESESGSENSKIMGSHDGQVPRLLPYESEIPPLRISKSLEGQSSTAMNTNPQGSEVDLALLPRSRQLPPHPATPSATMRSNNEGSESGLFPLPPPVNGRRASDRGSDGDGDETQEDEPEQTKPAASLDSRPKTHAPLVSHHRSQIIDFMGRKVQEIKLHEALGNSCVFHLDWSAGNPGDPCTRPLDEPGTGEGNQLSDEDLALKSRIAELVESFTREVRGPQRDDEWSKTMFFGDWITNSTNENNFFIEIQIKRVSGAHDDLMKRCGIHSRQVWLPLADPDYHDPKPNSPASSTTQNEGQRPLSPEPLLPISAIRNTGAFGDAGNDATAECPGRPGASIPHSGTISSLGDMIRTAQGRLTSSVDEVINRISRVPMGSGQQPIAPSNPEVPLSSGKRPRDAMSAEPDSTMLPVDDGDTSLVNSTGGGERSGTRRKLPDSSAGDGERSGPRRKLPKLPLSDSPSWGSNISNNGSLATSNSEVEGNGKTDDAAAKADQDFAKSFPRIKNLLAFQKTLRLQRDQTLERLMKEPDFPWRKDNSFIYCVRVVALPGVAPVTNRFRGPMSVDRRATLLGSGGWIVPPLEDRMRWHNDNKENRPASLCSRDDIATQNFQTRPETTETGRVEGLGQSAWDKVKKKAHVCRALPAEFDWSGNSAPRDHGELCPVWRELAEPCLEDVYWMVWQLLAGKQYVGFAAGTRFGRESSGTAGEASILVNCPFQSPSPEAIRLSALL